MRPEILAILAAFGWAVNGVLVRKGARHSDVSSAVFLSFLTTVCLIWAVSFWYFPGGFLRSPALFYFIASGLIQPALVRFLHYTGIARLGASRAEPLRSTTPLFASLIAFAALKERAGFIVYGAIALTISGASLISYRRKGEAEWKLFDLVFPLAAAFLAAVSQNIRKAGLNILPNALVAAAVTTTVSLLVFASTVVASGKTRALRVERASLPFYGSAALVSAASQLLTFSALSQAEVSVVVTLNSTTPLFTVALSSLFLRDLEKVTSHVVVGTVLLVAAIVLIINR